MHVQFEVQVWVVTFAENSKKLNDASLSIFNQNIAHIMSKA